MKRTLEEMENEAPSDDPKPVSVEPNSPHPDPKSPSGEPELPDEDPESSSGEPRLPDEDPESSSGERKKSFDESLVEAQLAIEEELKKAGENAASLIAESESKTATAAEEVQENERIQKLCEENDVILQFAEGLLKQVQESDTKSVRWK
ncbi:hypothetical protein RYX36_028646 [Vicia faba]